MLLNENNPVVINDAKRKMVIQDNLHHKIVMSKDYKYVFNKNNGEFFRWGVTKKDDPEFAPAPEILDIEVSTICSGIKGVPCSHCYKSNTHCGKNMSLDTYKEILGKFHVNLISVAMGIGDIDANKDLFEMMKFTHDVGVIPNITINGARLTDCHVKQLSALCGAVSVSHYGDNDICYDAIYNLTEAGCRQVNIHKLLSEETYDECFKVIDDIVNDKRLEKLNALTFLLLKPKGKRNKYHKITDYNKFEKLIRHAIANKVLLGFDSCFAPIYTKVIRNCKDLVTDEQFKKLEEEIESCESTLFSCYINVDGKYFPCSFCEDEVDGINVLEYNSFNEIWETKFKDFRDRLINNKDENKCRRCPVFNIY